MHYGTLSFKLSVKYNLATLRINYMTALRKARKLSSECEIGVCPQGREAPLPTPKSEWRLDSDGAWHGQDVSHRGPWETGLLEECGQGVGLWGRDENSF